MSTIINGTTDAITFPDATVQNTSAVVSGKVPYSVLPTGSVLQVVQGTTSSPQVSTTSTSYVASNLTATITPKFSTSKILAIASTQMTNTTGSQASYCTIYRNATNLGGGNNSALQQYYSTTAYIYLPVIMQILDSPATTSATTYTVYFKSGSAGTTYLTDITNTNSIVLMEIAG